MLQGMVVWGIMLQGMVVRGMMLQGMVVWGMMLQGMVVWGMMLQGMVVWGYGGVVWWCVACSVWRRGVCSCGVEYIGVGLWMRYDVAGYGGVGMLMWCWVCWCGVGHGVVARRYVVVRGVVVWYFDMGYGCLGYGDVWNSGVCYGGVGIVVCVWKYEFWRCGIWLLDMAVLGTVV